MKIRSIASIVDTVREKGISISDAEVEDVRILCERKMQISQVKNPEEYLPILFEDEIKNYLFRRTINSASMLMMKKKGEEECAVYV